MSVGEPRYFLMKLIGLLNKGEKCEYSIAFDGFSGSS